MDITSPVQTLNTILDPICWLTFLIIHGHLKNMYQRTISFVSLFFKKTMDFHTFVFPKKFGGLGCYQYIHEIGRMTFKKFICRENLETEICSLISKLYLSDWRLVYHLITYTNSEK